MAGEFLAVGDDYLSFAPRYPLLPGVSYTLLVDGVISGSATVPVRAGVGSTRVVAIYPSAREVPLNLLKVYVQFSARVAEGQARSHVNVLRADDARQLEGVFLPMEPELWDPGRTRLTLLLDPGRIKRGLAPHLEIGYPLQERVSVLVRVNPSMRDADGRCLSDGMQRRYAVGPAVRQHVSPSTWRVHAPAVNSVEPVVVEFDRPLDHALLQHALMVADGRGHAVPGDVQVAEGELRWSFTPRDRWQAESYSIRVDPRLEDVAGNSLTRVFDRDLTRPADTPRSLGEVTVAFEPRV